MNFIERFFVKMNDLSIRALIRIVLILLIVYLVMMTDKAWMGFIRGIFGIFKPFLYGFIIAYVLQEPIRYGQKHNISKKISIPVLYVLGLILVYWLVSALVPMILSRAGGFINSMIGGVNWLYSHYATMSENVSSNWIKEVADSLVASLSSFQNELSSTISSNLPGFVSDTLSHFTTFMFSVIISIYLCGDWEKHRTFFLKIIGSRSMRSVRITQKINDEVSSYLRSMLILMLITFVEYAVLYGVIGHPDWLILGVLTALGHLVPYVGPMFANGIGLLTALNMPGGKFVILIIMIVVLSNVDPYLIQPFVHARNTKISPLSALFSVYTGGRLLGVRGFIAAIPFYLIIRVVYLAHMDADYLEDEAVQGGKV